jgi:hypothetical protein
MTHWLVTLLRRRMILSRSLAVGRVASYHCQDASNFNTCRQRSNVHLEVHEPLQHFFRLFFICAVSLTFQTGLTDTQSSVEAKNETPFPTAAAAAPAARSDVKTCSTVVHLEAHKPLLQHFFNLFCFSLQAAHALTRFHTGCVLLAEALVESDGSDLLTHSLTKRPPASLSISTPF